MYLRLTVRSTIIIVQINKAHQNYQVIEIMTYGRSVPDVQNKTC